MNQWPTSIRWYCASQRRGPKWRWRRGRKKKRKRRVSITKILSCIYISYLPLFQHGQESWIELFGRLCPLWLQVRCTHSGLSKYVSIDIRLFGASVLCEWPRLSRVLMEPQQLGQSQRLGQSKHSHESNNIQNVRQIDAHCDLFGIGSTAAPSILVPSLM